MVLLPVLSALISGWFAYSVGRQYFERRKPHQILWTISLALAALGSAAYAISISTDGQFFFRIYYLSGAIMMAALLGVGSMYLSFGPALGRLSLLVVAGLGILVAGAVMAAPLDHGALISTGVTVSSGRGVISLTGLMSFCRILLNAFGTLAVGGAAVKSFIDLRQKQAPRGLVVGNLLIAVGVLANAMAGTMARWMTSFDPFWLLMTLGWGLMYSGFNSIDRVLLPQDKAKARRLARTQARSVT